MEIRSALWQRLFALVVFGFIGFLGAAAMLKAFLPEQVTVIRDNGESAAFLFGSGLGVVLLSVYGWRRTERYCLCADEEGITQQTGFGVTRVRWRDVASYRLERVRHSTEHRMEPVLYDSTGRVLLRPVAPMIVGTKRQDRERARFWQFVQDRLPGKRSRE